MAGVQESRESEYTVRMIPIYLPRDAGVELIQDISSLGTFID